MEILLVMILTLTGLSINENVQKEHNYTYAIPEPVVHIDDIREHSSLALSEDAICKSSAGAQRVQVCINTVEHHGDEVWINPVCSCRTRLVTTEVIEL